MTIRISSPKLLSLGLHAAGLAFLASGVAPPHPETDPARRSLSLVWLKARPEPRPGRVAVVPPPRAPRLWTPPPESVRKLAVLPSPLALPPVPVVNRVPVPAVPAVANIPAAVVPPAVRSAGFDTPAAPPPSAPEMAALRIQTGAFAAPGTPPAAVSAQAPVRVAAAGFGAAEPSSGPVIRPARHLAAAGFSEMTATPAERIRPALAPLAAAFTRALEILDKPQPAYTDEARRLQIEGEVLLEVRFTASATVRVLRVVRALGHGLDESAAAAACAIRFRPAERGGQAVDTVAQVRMVFQLAY